MMLAGLLDRATRRPSVRNTLTTTMVNMIVLCLNLGTGLLTARFLGPDGRGEFAAMLLWPQFLASLLTLGLPQAITFDMVRHPEDQRGIVGIALLASLGLGLLAMALGVVVIPIWAGNYSTSVIGFAQSAMFLAPVILIMWAVNGCLQAHGLFALYNRNLYLQPILALAGLSALALLDRITPLSAALATVLAPLPVFAANLEWLFRVQRPTLAAPVRNGTRLLRYGLRSCGIQLLNALSQQFDSIYVLGVLDPGAVGLYVVARSAAKPTMLFATAMNAVLFPKASALATGDAVDLAALAARVGIVAATLIAVPLATLGTLLIGLLYRPEFVEAAGPFQILVAEGVITAINLTLAQAFMTVGRPGVVTLLQLTSFLAGAVLLIILVPPHGIVGAALALLSAAVIRLTSSLACFPLILGTAIPRLWLNLDDVRLLLLSQSHRDSTIARYRSRHR
jgi:antigen flippase